MLGPGLRVTGSCRRLSMVAALAVMLSACSQPGSTPQNSRSDRIQSARSVAEDGEIRLELTCSPAKLSLSGEATIVVTITRPRSMELSLPKDEPLSSVFVVRDFEAGLPGLDNDRIVVRHSYTVEAKDAGKLTIPRMQYGFEPRDGKEFAVATKPLEIEVTTMISEEDRSLRDLEAPARPMELPLHPMQYILWGLAVAAALALIVTAIVRRKHHRTPTEPPQSAGQIAERELAELRASEIAKSDVKEFYVRLTGIVRRYIEGTTGVRAPEQTTDEFLREIGQLKLFSTTEQTRFGEFLEAADLVKYAAYAPSDNDVTESLTRAARFVTLESSRSTPSNHCSEASTAKQAEVPA